MSRLMSDEQVQLGRCRVVQGRALLIAALVAGWGALESGYCSRLKAEWAADSFKAAPVLSMLSAAAFELYMRIASSMPCPRYLHLAGLYCLLTTLDNMSVSLTFLGGCARLEMTEVSAMLGVIVLQMGAFGVVQLMILLKVMTLNADRAFWPIRLARFAVFFLISWSVMFAARAGMGAFVHRMDYSGFFENLAGVFFIISFVGFTLSCAWQMLRAAAKVNNDRILVSHGISTIAANSTSALRMAYIMASQYFSNDDVETRYVFVHCIDIVLNLICVLCVSGIVSALTTGEVDILKDFRITLLSVRPWWSSAPAATVGSPAEGTTAQELHQRDLPTLLASSANTQSVKSLEP